MIAAEVQYEQSDWYEEVEKRQSISRVKISQAIVIFSTQFLLLQLHGHSDSLDNHLRTSSKDSFGLS